MAGKKNQKQRADCAPKPATPLPPPKVEVVSIPKLEVEVRREAESDEQIQRTHGPKKPWTGFETRSYWVAVLGFAATVIALIVYGCQLSEMRRATEAAVTSAEASREATKVSVEALEISSGSLEVARDTAKRQLRAYLGITGIVITKPGQGIGTGKNGDVFLSIKNFGQTPAREVVSYMFWNTLPKQSGSTIEKLPDDFAFPDFSPRDFSAPVGPRSQLRLEPGQETFNSVILDTQIRPFDEEFNARLTLFVYGRIEYRDSYNVHHTRRFYYVYHPSPTAGANLMAMDSHNDELDDGK